MIPPGALSGSRRMRIVKGSMLTIGTGLPALFLLAIGVAPGVNRQVLSDWLLPLGFGVAFGVLAYGFGRVTLAAWTETRARRIAEPGYWPYAMCLLAVVVALASIPLSR
jgi:hypothetical protein